MQVVQFVNVAEDLELAGLIWQPEIGDEISFRQSKTQISVLVDAQGMSPAQLRSTYLWLPNVEQMVFQLEARQAILFHAGLELSESQFCYKTVVKSCKGSIESQGESLRSALGMALRNLLIGDCTQSFH